MQRARQSLPYFAALGWDAEVLCVAAEDVAAPLDPLLAAAIPAGVPIHRVSVMSAALGRWLGRGTLGPRARGPLRRAGDALLRTGRFDLVFFTTTQFIVLTLGPKWRQLHGVPFVVDWQDPWFTDYYLQPGSPKPPGGWKYRFSRRQAKRHEGQTLQHAAGWVGTSEVYQRDLAARYEWFARIPRAVIPFGADRNDFDIAQRHAVAAAFSRRTGVRHLVYVGAVGAIMRPALQLFFAGLREWLSRHPEARTQLAVHFIGTSYAPPGREVHSVRDLAHAAGVGDLVEEQPARIGHFAALSTMRAADALLLLGSADAGYSPSKIATLALAERPVLALVPGDGALAAQLRELKFAQVACFAPKPDTAAVTAFFDRPWHAVSVNATRCQHLSAEHRTRELTDLFSQALSFAATAHE